MLDAEDVTNFLLILFFAFIGALITIAAVALWLYSPLESYWDRHQRRRHAARHGPDHT